MVIQGRERGVWSEVEFESEKGDGKVFSLSVLTFVSFFHFFLFFSPVFVSQYPKLGGSLAAS